MTVHELRIEAVDRAEFAVAFISEENGDIQIYMEKPTGNTDCVLLLGYQVELLRDWLNNDANRTGAAA